MHNRVLSPALIKSRRAYTRIEKVGLFFLLLGLLTLLISPGTLAGAFDKVLKTTKPIVVDVFLTGEVGIAVVISVIIGRLLERLGFTDAMMRIFVPSMRLIGVNSAVIVPSVYNIFGDINAAGRISGPLLKKAGATKAEQKIAVATMVQSQQSFSTFMLGMMALSFAGVNVFFVVMVAIFGPLLISPFLLSRLVYKDVKPLSDIAIPKFTPETEFVPMLFKAAREGVELLFLILIPAVALVFCVIGLLDYVGVWAPIDQFLQSTLSVLGIHAETGVLAILVSPTLAMGKLQAIASTLDPRLVVGSFVLASSGLPLSSIFGQIPVVWAEASDLTEKEAMGAAVLGLIMRVTTAVLISFFLTPLLV